MLQSQTKNKEWHDTQFQGHMHFIPGGTVRLRLRAFQVFSPKKTKGIRERKRGMGGRWGGGKGERNRIKKISIWARLRGEHGAWAEPAQKRPCHPHVTLGDRQLAPHSESKWTPKSRENRGATKRPFKGHPKPLVPSARDTLSWDDGLDVPVF